MSEIVTIKLKHSCKINYTMINTGEPGIVISTNKNLLLSIGRIYQIPVSVNLNLDDFNVFKTFGKLREKLDIRNIRDGFVFIHPIIHNVLITDGQELGTFL